MNNNEKETTPEKKPKRNFYPPRKKKVVQPVEASPLEVEMKGLKTFAEQKITKVLDNIVPGLGKTHVETVVQPKPLRPNTNKPKTPKPDESHSVAAEGAQEKARVAAPKALRPNTNQQKATGEVMHKTATTQPKPVKPSGNQPKTTKNAEGKAQKPMKDTGKKLKIIPLGGLGEIGKNMTVFEYENDIIIVDCGMTFPNDDMLGVDLVIPDISYLKRNMGKIRAFVITHGHEDHIGGLPYILRDLNVPIYCTALPAGILKNKLAEHKNLKKAKIITKKAGDVFKLGVFEVEMIHVNHSIADAVALAIKTPVGKCIFMGDFKIDTTPVDGHFIDLARFGELGKEGVLMLMSDSTNAERTGMSMSEKNVGVALDAQFKNCNKRILVASFSSNIHRLQQILDISVKYGRKVCISGRSMENMFKVGMELGYLTMPEGTLVDISLMKKYPKEKMTVITTGSQGEPMSALMRMSMGSHKQIHISPDDKILISAHPIPGNEKSVYTLINELVKRGAEVVYDKSANLHVSGHACGEELKMILALTKPQYFMPMHGEYRHLTCHAELAKSTGVLSEHIFISEIGKVLELSEHSARFNGTVPSGKVLVDGLGVGDVGQTVLRDRQHLSQDGLLIIVTTFDAETATVVAGPDIICRGFNLTKDTTDISDHVRTVASETIESCLERNLTDWATIKSELRAKLSDYVYKVTKRNPMILPINMEV